ncbi:MAG: D-alanyl-D-alanine carboxypeptidase family protein [Alphaproteobacteria bacterium]|nr:D-alanyl-D-alanine carboxypeptidase family protein [Alphaproteobacteria bacterium]
MKMIQILETENPPSLTEIKKSDGFFLNLSVVNHFEIRSVVYEMLKKAKENLPTHLTFMIYEAYRTFALQEQKFQEQILHQKKLYPVLSEQEIHQKARVYTADPKRESGHQTGGAVDITLCDLSGKELDMGTDIHEFVYKTRTHSDRLSDFERENRRILLDALTAVGFVNYPAEWWHFSYGDRLWAKSLGKTETLFAPVHL